MTSINNLTSADELSANDQVPIWGSGNQDTRKATLSVLAAFLQTLLTAGGGLKTQYAAPTATGQTTIVVPPTAGASVWLEMTPLGTYAAGTILLPAAAMALDGQEILVTSTLAVTTLTVQFMNASGSTVTVVGAPTTLGANGFFRMRFDPVYKLWIRVG